MLQLDRHAPTRPPVRRRVHLRELQPPGQRGGQPLPHGTHRRHPDGLRVKVQEQVVEAVGCRCSQDRNGWPPSALFLTSCPCLAAASRRSLGAASESTGPARAALSRSTCGPGVRSRSKAHPHHAYSFGKTCMDATCWPSFCGTVIRQSDAQVQSAHRTNHIDPGISLEGLEHPLRAPSMTRMPINSSRLLLFLGRHLRRIAFRKRPFVVEHVENDCAEEARAAHERQEKVP